MKGTQSFNYPMASHFNTINYPTRGPPFLFLGRVIYKIKKALKATKLDLATKLFYTPKISYFLPNIWANLFWSRLLENMEILALKINPMEK